MCPPPTLVIFLNYYSSFNITPYWSYLIYFHPGAARQEGFAASEGRADRIKP
jgi:hypothetical protein